MPISVVESGDDVIRVGIMLGQDRALFANAIGVVLGLEPQFEVVAIESNPAAGPVQILAAGADVVLVDDVSFIAHFQGTNAGKKIVVIAGAGHPEIALASIRAGVSACVSHTTSPAALADIVRRVHAGETVYEQDVLLELIQRPTITVPPRPRRTAMLSERELEVLRAMATGARASDVAQLLGISLNTVRTHLKNILVKLEAGSRLEAVIIAIREGRIELPSDVP